MKVGRAGFTLLEVMIALTIMALGFAAIFAGISQSAKNIDKLRRFQQREMLTRDLLDSLDLVELHATDVASGTFPDGTRWRMETKPFILPSSRDAGGLLRVELRLEWDAVSGVQKRTIETFRRYLPPRLTLVHTLQDQLDALR